MCVTIRGLIFQDFVNEACLYYPMPHFDLNKIQFTLIFIFILICCIPAQQRSISSLLLYRAYSICF